MADFDVYMLLNEQWRVWSRIVVANIRIQKPKLDLIFLAVRILPSIVCYGAHLVQ